MLVPEWKARIEHWQKVMSQLFFRKLGTVEMEGFFTHEQMQPREAAKRKEFRPVKTGTAWGGMWEYAWFRGNLKLPKEAAGERIAIRVDVGAECAIYVGGSAAGQRLDWGGLSFGATDNQHKEVTLTRKAKGGEKFDLLIEAYGGHGPRNCGGGPTPHGFESVPVPQKPQCTMRETAYGVWNEELYQLWMDTLVLMQLRNSMADQESLRVQRIDEALMAMTVAVDLELPHDEMMKTVREGRKILKPVLDCHNGSTAPLMYCFGHSHIDVAWLWPLRETESKCTRTFGTMLNLMEEYPEYRFLQSQPHLYHMVKTSYPDLYDRLKQAVKKGKVIPEGGMWVEADTNITGGESLIRQFVHGKRFFAEEFGVDSKMLWLPDVFGYSGALPQIMKGCGVDYFSTQKIFWNYNGGQPFPYVTFWWEGIDGTRVFSHFHNDYNGKTSPEALMQRWKERPQKNGLHGRLVPFGWGDGGGGPTREHLECLRRCGDLEGLPRTEIAHPNRYFEDSLALNQTWPTYVGELYFQCHRGTFTSQAKTKKGNRRSEFGLREAELWGALACAVGGYDYPLAQLDKLWKVVLLNQFHDIIPGSSIKRVYEEAERDYDKVVADAAAIAQDAASTFLQDDKDALTVLNPLSWERDALVPLPKGFGQVETEDGRALPVQSVGGQPHALVEDIPSCGWTTLRKSKAEAAAPAVAVKATKTGLENEFFKVTFNRAGEISSLVEKENGRELAAAPLNAFRMYKDVPRCFDAWDIDSTYKSCPVELEGKATIEVVESGPVVATLRITRMLNQSPMVQEVSVVAGSRRIDFRTTVEWQEKHKLLKVCFPVTVRSHEALNEIQFGHIARPTHASQQFDADRFEVAQQKWTALCEQNRGVALLNDSKYGIDSAESSLNLTLLKSAIAPDMTADLGKQEFVYSFTAWSGSFASCDVVRQAYELNAPVRTLPGRGGRASLLRVSSPDVVVETVKAAEDGSGDVVVRLYESKRGTCDCLLEIDLPVKKAWSTDMLEAKQESLPCSDGRINLSFRPFEIKTLRLAL